MQAKAGGKTFAVDPIRQRQDGRLRDHAAAPGSERAIHRNDDHRHRQRPGGGLRPGRRCAIDVIADLNKLVKPGDQLAPGKLSTPPCTVTQASTTGTIVLACSATDYSQPTSTSTR